MTLLSILDKLEQQIIGTFLLFPHTFEALSGYVKAEYFDNPKHQTIIKLMFKVVGSGMSIDYLTFMYYVVKANKLTTDFCLENPNEAKILMSKTENLSLYITSCTTKVCGYANIEHYLFILFEAYIDREYRKKINELKAEPGKIEKGIEELSNFFTNSVKHYKETIVSAKESVKNYCKMLDTNKKMIHRKVLGVYSGFKGLDSYLEGWEVNTYNVIGGAPGCGKTQFGLNTLIQLITTEDPDYETAVLLINLEMTNNQLINRIAATMLGIPKKRLMRGYLTNEEALKFSKTCSVISNMPFFQTLSGDLTISQLKNVWSQFKKRVSLQHNSKKQLRYCLMVDYLQLLKPNKTLRSKAEEIAEISQELNKIKLEDDTFVIAFSQFNRDPQKRAGGEPVVSDLRESGQIEQDANNIILLWRPFNYGVKMLDDGTHTDNLLRCLVKKNREGNLGYFDLEFNGETGKMRDFSKDMETIQLSELPF